MDNKTKEIILDRLFKTSSYCGHCGKEDCGDRGKRHLSPMIKRSDVLRAINLDEYYFKEDATT